MNGVADFAGCPHFGRAVDMADRFPLPEPKFQAAHERTVVTVYAPRRCGDREREERSRAFYRHALLRWVVSEEMTHQSLRARFRLLESKSAVVS